MIITSAREDTKRQLRQMYPRLVLISALGDTSRGGKVLLNGVRARVSWEEVYLVHHHASAESNQLLPSQRTIPVMPMNLTLATPVHFDELSIWKFEQESGAHLVSVTNTGLPWKGDPPATYIFRFSESEWPFLVIQVGQCQAEDQSEKSHHAEPASLWATVGWMSGRDSPTGLAPPTDHDCQTDHVSQWPSSRRSFTQTRQGPLREASSMLHYILLSFLPCWINPERTLVLEVLYDGTRRAQTRPYSPLFFSSNSGAQTPCIDQEHSADTSDACSSGASSFTFVRAPSP